MKGPNQFSPEWKKKLLCKKTDVWSLATNVCERLFYVTGSDGKPTSATASSILGVQSEVHKNAKTIIEQMSHEAIADRLSAVDAAERLKSLWEGYSEFTPAPLKAEGVEYGYDKEADE